MIKLSSQLYLHQDTCNVYVLKNRNHCLLIDFGSGNILQALGEIEVNTVDAILITHHHRDQLQGLSLIAAANIPIYVPHNEQDLIADARGMWMSRCIYNNYNNRQDRFSSLASIPIAGTLKDYSEFKWLDYIFTVHPTPGHTTGSISLSTQLDDARVAFTGDLIYAPGKVWSLAALQWSYNGGEGIPHTILSLLDLSDKNIEYLYPSHGEPMDAGKAIPPTIENLILLKDFRRHNPRLLELREKPYEKITDHLLFNRTSMCNSYVLLSRSGKAAIIDLGYDFMAGTASGSDRSSRRPWLYTFPWLIKEYHLTGIDICLATHYHDDHVAGFNLLRDTYGTTVVCPENFSHILEHPEAYDIPCLWYDSIPVDQVVKLNERFTWEEYEFKIHPISGHTKYSVAIEFEVDQKKVLCTGDQYADDDLLFCNYVYKNIFEPEDFIHSASLLSNIQPDLILSGHWQGFTQKENYLELIKDRGNQLLKLHQELLPLETYRFPSSDFCASMHPFQLIAKPFEKVTIQVNVTNPLPEAALMTLFLVLPHNFTCTAPIQEHMMKPHETLSVPFIIQIPGDSCYKELIGCDITLGEHHFGQHAEMMVTVK